MSTIEVNKIAPVSGGTTVQIGESGDTINIPSGATIANAGTATGFLPNNLTFTGGLLTAQTDANEQDALLIKQSDGTDVGSLRINNGSFLLKGKNSSSPVQIQTHDGNEDIEVDPDGFIKFEAAGSERMRIASNGMQMGNLNESLGFSSSSHGLALSGNGYASLRVRRGADNGQAVAFYGSSSNSTPVGDISVTTSSTAYNTSSDYRLKENEVAISDGITRLKSLKPYRFNFKTEPDTTVDGFFAHEVSSVVPEAISGEKDAMAVETRYTADDVETQGDTPSKNVGDPKTYSSTVIDAQGIDQAKLVPLLTAALKEAITKIETLEAKVAALESA